MTTTQDLIAQEHQYLMQTYKRFPIALTKGEGVRVWDAEGKCYLDFLAGIAVNALGYNHPAVRATIQAQSSGLIHTSNLFYTRNQIELAKLLTAQADLDCAFYCNSGAEANEGAFKLARKWGQGRYEILTAQQSFHGRTLAAVSATGQTKYQQGFQPLMPGFQHIPYNDLDALRQAISPHTVGVLLEAVQGEGGIQPARPEYLAGVAALCQEHQLLLMFDEVQCGMGRTGKLFAYQHYAVQPDIVTVAKGLGCGFPIGMMLAKRSVAQAFEYGDHASTFGGGEFVTGVALTFARMLTDDGLLAHVTNMGQLLAARLHELQQQFPALIIEARGLGLMAGLQLEASVSAGDVSTALRENGLLTATAGGNVIRFVPPLIIQSADIDEAAAILAATLARFA